MGQVEVVKDPITFFQRHPSAWIENYLETSLWGKQKEIIDSVVDHRRVTVRSCHGSGKTFGAACLVLWHAYCFPPSNRVITTAPTMRQVRDLLWAEIGGLHPKLERKIYPVGELLQTRLRFSKNHYAVGYSTDNPEAFQGHHALHMLLVVDEAGGVPNEIYEAAQGILTGDTDKVLLIGNPTRPHTYFHKTHVNPELGFRRYRISVFDTPNVTIARDGKYYPVVPKPFPGLVDLDFAERNIKIYGIQSPFVKARIFGEFPLSAEDQLIPDNHLAAAAMKGIVLRNVIKRLSKGTEVIDINELKRIRGIPVPGRKKK